MKLHLPKSLRQAVLACCFAAVGITTTVGTASIHGGMASFILTAQAAAEEITGIIISSSGDARLTSTPAGEQIIMQLDGGYLAGSQHTGFDVLADILIKVLRINDGNSNATYNFKGDITGDGSSDILAPSQEFIARARGRCGGNETPFLHFLRGGRRAVRIVHRDSIHRKATNDEGVKLHIIAVFHQDVEGIVAY